MIRAAARYPDFDGWGTASWLVRIIGSPDYRVLTGRGCVAIGCLVRSFHHPMPPVGHCLFLFGSPFTPWDPVKMLRLLIQWARVNGAKRFRFGSDTETDVSPLARRLGARQDKPSFTLDLE